MQFPVYEPLLPRLYTATKIAFLSVRRAFLFLSTGSSDSPSGLKDNLIVHCSS